MCLYDLDFSIPKMAAFTRTVIDATTHRDFWSHEMLAANMTSVNLPHKITSYAITSAIVTENVKLALSVPASVTVYLILRSSGKGP